MSESPNKEVGESLFLQCRYPSYFEDVKLIAPNGEIHLRGQAVRNELRYLFSSPCMLLPKIAQPCIAFGLQFGSPY